MCHTCKHTNGKPPKIVSLPSEKGRSEATLDKYAQLGKTSKNALENDQDEFKDLTPGTSINDKETLIKRQKRKFLSHWLSLNLINHNKAQREINLDQLETELENQLDDLSPAEIQERYYTVENQDRDIIRSYWNMYRCNKEMVKDKNGIIKTRYCKNRLCLTCNSIRTAQLLDKYQPIFDAWKGKMYLVTLTIENVTADKLPGAIEEMNKCFIKAKDSIKKLYQDGQTEKFEGLRKFECTSLREDDYHPHFHILVKGYENSKHLVNYWLNAVNKTGTIRAQLKGTNSKGKQVYLQDIRQAKNYTDSNGKKRNVGKELFKYFTKIISTASTEQGKLVYTERLDTIFKAIRGKRTFQTFGFKLSDYVEQQAEAITDEEQSFETDEIQNYLDPTHTSEQRNINALYDEFYKGKLDSSRALDLMAGLYELECNHKTEFKEIQLQTRAIPNFNPHERRKQQRILADLERSEKDRSDILYTIQELAALEAQRDFSLDLEYQEGQQLGDHQADEQEEIYIFNGSVGNWINPDTGEPLTSYILGEYYQDISKRFVLSKPIKAKLMAIGYDT